MKRCRTNVTADEVSPLSTGITAVSVVTTARSLEVGVSRQVRGHFTVATRAAVAVRPVSTPRRGSQCQNLLQACTI